MARKPTLKRGNVFAFDDLQLHEVKNEGDHPRTNLIIDCWAPWSVPGDRLLRMKHRLAHRFGVKRSDMVAFFPTVLEQVKEFREQNPGGFDELAAQVKGS